MNAIEAPRPPMCTELCSPCRAGPGITPDSTSAIGGIEGRSKVIAAAVQRSGLHWHRSGNISMIQRTSILARRSGRPSLWAQIPLEPAVPIAFTRPIYPYPLQAKYKGRGSPNDAVNFVPVSSDATSKP
jgi:hypothetical protein